MRAERRRQTWVGVMVWAALGLACAPDFDVTGRDACQTHADCLSPAVCVVTGGEPLGRCVVGGSFTDRDVGPDGDSDADPDGSDADPDAPSCPQDACDLSSSVCVGEDMLADCVAGPDGCGVLADPVRCPGGQRCAAARCIDPTLCQDADQDGYGQDCPAGNDCDDDDPGRNPGRVEVCDAIDQDCDGNPRNGFQIDSDPDHCGMCENRCEGAHAVWSCAASRCVVDRCESGWSNPNLRDDDGCEVPCLPTTPTEAACTDGVDDDCDNYVDGDDDDCATARLLEGSWRGVHLQRTAFPNTEVSTLAEITDITADLDGVRVVTSFAGSPAAPGGGYAVNTTATFALQDRGAGRLTLTDNGGGVLQGFASRDDRASTLLFAAPPGAPLRVWGSRLWLWTRRADVSFALLDGAWLGAFFRGRAHPIESNPFQRRPYQYQPTWLGTWRFTANSTEATVQAETSATGPPWDEGDYPLDVEVGRTQDNSIWAIRSLNGAQWDEGIVGDLALAGNTANFAIYDDALCNQTQVRTRACPPEAGVATFIRPATDARHNIQGRWALLGVWLARGEEPNVTGEPTFLAVEVRVDATLALRGEEDFASLGALGRAEQRGPNVTLFIAGLPPTEGFEPAALTLTGTFAADGLSALLVVDSADRPGPGLFWLLRL